MLVELLITLLAAIGSGLLPGLHANNSVQWIPSPNVPSFESVLLVAVLAGFYAAFELFKTLFLGVADSESIGPAFAGPRLVKQGKSSNAISSAIIGLLTGAILAILLSGLVGTIGQVHSVFFQNIFPIVAGLALLLIFRSIPRERYLMAIVVVLSASALGLISLRHPLVVNPLTSLMIGFFAIPVLLESFILPPISFSKNPFPIRLFHLKESVKGSVSAMGMVLFPAIGPSFSAAISGLFLSNAKNLEGEVSRMSALSMANVVFGFWGIYYLDATRNGTAVVASAMWHFTFMEMVFFSGVVICSLSIGLFVFWKIHPILIKGLQLIPQLVLRGFLMLLLFVLVGLESGLMGLVVMMSAACVAMVGKKESIRPALLMSFLAVPLLVSIY